MIWRHLLLLVPLVSFAAAPQHVDVFVSGQDGFHTFRIPSVVVTTNGTVLAFAEARRSQSDQSENKIVLKRSTDGGQTWGVMQLIADSGKASLNNPCAVVDQTTGRVVLMYQNYPPGAREFKKTTARNAGRAIRTWVTTSDDNGRTWSTPGLLDSVQSEKAATTASGPGIGIQLTRGPHAGRLIIPFNERVGSLFGVYAAYSDDKGASWKMGQRAPGAIIPDGKGGQVSLVNEVQMVELSDGAIMLNSRAMGGRHLRKIDVSHDGGMTWSNVKDDPTLREPRCMASILRYSFDESIILFSNPDSAKRNNGTIRASFDEGKTWPVKRVLEPGLFAYSSLTRLPDGMVGCLYETGAKVACERIVFARFPLTWLTVSPALIPAPQKAEWTGTEVDCARYSVEAPAEAGFAAAELDRVLSHATHDPAGITFTFRSGMVTTNRESYALDIGPTGITITASTPVGWLYGVQTLRQLLAGGTTIPGGHITDWPAVPWRGFMHDVGRNPQDVELLKRFVDVMAQYKMNVFQFHLTDYPGYRIECRSHPELNDPKFMIPTRRPGFFYTYAQINDFIAYCRQRGITVIPEIDMPGHSDYFNRAFGVDMQSEKGMKILTDCVNEFFDNVQTEYFHMGSDEVSLKNAKFMDQMADVIRQRGRKLLVWRPGHLPKGEVITQLWGSGKKSDPLPGVASVDSRHDYINHMDPFDGPARILNLATTSLGGILCHWPDDNVGDQMNIYRQSPVFPALLAATERYWTGHTPQRPEYFGRLPPLDDVYTDFEQRMLKHRDLFFSDWPFPYVKQTGITWKLIGPLDLKVPVPTEPEFRNGCEARGATIHINHFWYDGWLPKARTGVAYAQTYVWSPTNQSVGFWINFNGPSRSGRDSPNPAKGEWSNTGSQVWVNDHILPPPDWKQPGKQTAEVPFVDEDYFYRPPTPVALKSGWNKILIKAPRNTGIRKWMFTCVPVCVTGNRVREVESLRFATHPTDL